ncbi:MAG: hypothetical protein M1820_002478 [Bogoriella megaspora]|nr:MAG: hypothetical protein M1820_002478 [Bogoriella megaspora]
MYFNRCSHEPLDLKDDQSEDRLIINLDEVKYKRRQPKKWKTVIWLVHHILLFAFMASTAFLWIRPYQSNCLERHFAYSPALEVVDDHYKTTRLKATTNSSYTGTPSEDVDRQWRDLLRVGKIAISENELQKVGAPAHSVQLPPESGGGYLAYLEGHHHLHCLYLLYQSLHEDYYSSHSVVWDMPLLERVDHWDHCIDFLRQYVMCNAETNVVTHLWVGDSDEPAPMDRNPRKCRDWNRIHQWQLDRQAPAPTKPLKKPKDAFVYEVLPTNE